MSEQAIEKLKSRVVRVAALAFMLVMTFMGGLMYSANLLVTSTEINEVLRYLISHDGELPSTEAEEFSAMVENDRQEAEAEEEEENYQTDNEGIASMVQSMEDALRQFMSGNGSYDTPEFAYSTRYFSVIYPAEDAADDGAVSGSMTDDDPAATTPEPMVKMSHIASVDRHGAIDYANAVRSRNRSFGRFGNYYYRVAAREDGSTIVVIMDCTSQITTSRHLLNIALFLIGFGMILSWLVLRWLAPRIVAPEVHNAELQKQFITNASHELKTPLAVIRANTELTEAMNGESEWTQSTMRQVDRLQGLIQNLVLITRAQEQDSHGDRMDTDLTQALGEQIETFRPVATQENKTLTVDIAENLHMLCEGGMIRELASVLIDNAIKYCDDGGEIKVRAWRKGRQVYLAVSNHYKDGADKDYSRFFDRFYREDQAHNVDKGGYGIGLSIAESIVHQYNGSIGAAWKDGVITFTCRLMG